MVVKPPRRRGTAEVAGVAEALRLHKAKKKPAAPADTPKNYVYRPEGEFRSARGKIESEWAVLKTWKRFANRLTHHSLSSLEDDSLVVAYCQNLRIASRLGLL